MVGRISVREQVIGNVRAAMSIAKLKPMLTLRRHVVVGLVSLLWLIPSTGLTAKFLGAQIGGFALIVGLVLISIALEMSRVFREMDRRAVAGRLTAIAVILLVLFVVLHPIAKSGWVGGGSDRDDALNVTIRALLGGHYPYATRTYLGNPPTPMPGAMLVALPAFLLGTSALQNVFWVPAFVKFSPALFGSSAMAVVYVLVTIVLCPASLQDYVTGGDYLANCLYVIIAIEGTMRTVAKDHNERMILLLSIILAICISSRPIYVSAVPVVGAWIYQQKGAKLALEALGVIVFAFAIINGPFYFYDPQQFPTTYLQAKVAEMPAFVHAASVLPAISLAIATSSLFVRLKRATVYGMIALSFVPIFAPWCLYRLLSEGATARVLNEFCFCLPVTVFANIWLFNVLATNARLDRRPIRCVRGDGNAAALTEPQEHG
jgi:hypothetical protein